MTTFEEAKRCPRCEQPGKPVGDRRIGRATIHNFICDNARCKWYNQPGWVVQRNPDGTVPETKHRDKQFPVIPDRTESVQSSAQRLLDQTLTPGSEIRNG